jgi:spore maturation protein CgeB
MIYVGPLTKGPDRDSSWITSFEKLGCSVIPFSSYVDYSANGFLEKIGNKICKRLSIGAKNKRLQENLLRLTALENPDWVHFILPLAIDRKTIKALKNKKIIVTQYFNDDPFSKHAPLGINWKFLRALTSYDGNFVWRAHNVKSYKDAGALYVEHSPPYYDPEKTTDAIDVNRPIELTCDAAFVGHWEGDWRIECLDALSKSGLKVVVRGGGWDDAVKNTSLENLSPITHAFGGEYIKIYREAIAGICFFSKINNDSWTRRALEIVAVGGVLVCERTEEAAQYFKDREEAYFFSTVNELISVVQFLKDNPGDRERARIAGFARLLAGDHAVMSRANRIFQFALNAYKNNIKSDINVRI